MPISERLAEQFEEQRAHLRAVAYRMLGSASEAEDAVQESWIRLGRSDVSSVENLRAWLTTVVSRVCLDMLRTRTSRREDVLDVHVPDPIIRAIGRADKTPEADAMLADSVGLALLVVLEKLEPAERLAFVLHDVFGMSFEEIAPIVDRSVVATRQLASRARRRVQGQAPTSDADLRKQRRVVDAFLTAVRDGDFERLVAVLDPDIVLRADGGAAKGMSRLVRGAQAVVEQAAAFSKLGLSNQLVLVNGSVGVVSRLPDGRVLSVIGFTIAGGRVVEMDILADPDRLGRLDLSAIADDPFNGRPPTSHERMTGLPWDASYHDGPPPWDIGQPQPAVVRLAAEGGFAGAVLDAGCGTGENALHIASLGLSVLGVDVAETALALAREKAAARGRKVAFAAADAFHLERLGRTFNTVLDCGLFHTFEDEDERSGYVASLASVTERDGILYVLCFSDAGPATGPHPVSQQTLRAAFNTSSGWNIAAIEPERIQTRFHDDGAPAWLATIKRI